MHTLSTAKNIFKIIVLFILSGAHGVFIIDAQPIPAVYTNGLPFPMPEVQLPVVPDRSVNIIDHGARGDGQTMNTDFINNAIQVCAKAGGGTVVVPAGIWLTGPLRLESNINLHVEKGAFVQFSKNIKDYPFIESSEGKQNKYRRAQLISAYQAKNIAITGDGIFDGAGEVWRYVQRRI